MGDEVKTEVRKNHAVQIEMQWSLQTDDRVKYDLWTTPSDPLGKDFQKRFKSVAQALQDRTYFTPHMYIYDGIKSYCPGFEGEKRMCSNLCTNNGRYCATNPDDDLDHGISGADIVKESLRRICIRVSYSDDDGVGSKWWDYVHEFMKHCDTPDDFANEDCVKDAYRHANVEESVIERCIEDSGGLEHDRTNTFLDLEMDAQVQRGVVILPTAFVNGIEIRGELSVNTMLAAICNGFLKGKEPRVCKECAGTSDVDWCIAKVKRSPEGTTEGSTVAETEGTPEATAIETTEVTTEETNKTTTEGATEAKVGGTEGMEEATAEVRNETTAEGSTDTEAGATKGTTETTAEVRNEATAERTAEAEASASTYSAAAAMCLASAVALWAMVLKQCLGKTHACQSTKHKDQRGLLATKVRNVEAQV